METTDGDTHAVERATLIDEITSDATAIDRLDSREAALAAVRRERQ